MLGEDRPTREVRLATRRRPVFAAQRFGSALAEEVDFEGGVDGDEPIFSCNVPVVVGVVDGPELDAGILRYELVQTVAASALLVMALFLWLRLRVPVTIPFSIRS